LLRVPRHEVAEELEEPIGEPAPCNPFAVANRPVSEPVA
jgi:hypothetical protein